MDWADSLPIAEFASNNHTSETTAVSPLFENLRYDPRLQFDLSAVTPDEPGDQRARSAAEALTESRHHLRPEMHRAQLRYRENADEIASPPRTIGW